MSFSITEYKFGDHRGIMIYHSEYKHHIDILPFYGALLSRVELFGHELVEPIDSAKQLIEDHWYRNFWLMPFQNRVRDGKYEFEDKTYQLPVTETDKNNALHGFFNELKSEDVNWEVADDQVKVSMRFEYAGGMVGYPFPFQCQIVYQIAEAGIIDISYEIVNSGQTNMPFTLGWHPYFQLEGERKDWTITTGRLNHYPLDERNLPTGQSESVIEQISLLNGDLDDCFAFKDKPHELLMESKKFKLKIEQDDHLSFIQVFTPPRNSVAIEPVSSGVDAFNTGHGLHVIKAGDKLSGQLKVSFEEKSTNFTD